MGAWGGGRDPRRAARGPNCHSAWLLREQSSVHHLVLAWVLLLCGDLGACHSSTPYQTLLGTS